MPIAIPVSTGGSRYRRAGAAVNPGGIASATDALRAFADDLLETGDVRIALERAFRWGYTNDQGERIAGLQEHLQELRHKRDRLLRQTRNERFLEALTPELDRLDVLDGEREAHLSDAAESEQSPLDRLVDRLRQGYRTDEARTGLDDLLREMRGAIGHEGDEGAPGSTGNRRGPGQPASAFGSMRSGQHTATDALRRMVFHGGSAPAAGAGGAWRQELGESPVRNALPDLALLAELDCIERVLERLEAIGGVTTLPKIDPADMGSDDIAAWLDGWSAAVTSLTDAGAAATAGAVSMPPEVIAAIGRDLLKGMFRAVRSPVTGEHHSMRRGNAGDPAEETVPWEPGRPLDLDLVATVSSAVRRGARDGRRRVQLSADDFVVVERATTVAVSTVLAIDRSRSMGQSGGWTAAKRVAMAMHELIRQAYPRDSLGIVAFSSTAAPVGIRDIPELDWDRFEHGTHLQAALALGRRTLRQRAAGTRQILVITDGEPTLATVRGEDVFASPPSPDVLNATMSEVIRCTREATTINIVMLGEAPGSRFAEQVARVNRGRVFIASRETLGSFVLKDYIAR